METEADTPTESGKGREFDHKMSIRHTHQFKQFLRRILTKTKHKPKQCQPIGNEIPTESEDSDNPPLVRQPKYKEFHVKHFIKQWLPQSGLHGKNEETGELLTESDSYESESEGVYLPHDYVTQS